MNAPVDFKEMVVFKKATLLPDCTHSVKLCDKLSITENIVQMWLTNKEIKTVSYTMDDKGKRTGSMTVYKRKRG